MRSEAEIQKWLQPCGSCDAGLAMDCTCPHGDPRGVIAELFETVTVLRDAVDVAARELEGLSSTYTIGFENALRVAGLLFVRTRGASPNHSVQAFHPPQRPTSMRRPHCRDMPSIFATSAGPI